MAKPAAVPAKATGIAKREPAIILTGAATLISTILFVAPSLGIPVPGTVQKVVAAALTVLAGFGIRPQVTPTAR